MLHRHTNHWLIPILFLILLALILLLALTLLLAPQLAVYLCCDALIPPWIVNPSKAPTSKQCCIDIQISGWFPSRLWWCHEGIRGEVKLTAFLHHSAECRLSYWRYRERRACWSIVMSHKNIPSSSYLHAAASAPTASRRRRALMLKRCSWNFRLELWYF